MPSKEVYEAYTHKRLKADVKTEIARVSKRAADSFLLEPNKVLRLYFTEQTPFSDFWNTFVRYDHPFRKRDFVPFVRSMCEVYRISRKHADQFQPQLFENE